MSQYSPKITIDFISVPDPEDIDINWQVVFLRKNDWMSFQQQNFV